MNDDAKYSLVCPFLNESLDYCLGVEFGVLYGQMRYGWRHGDIGVMSDCFHLANRDQILLLASRLGWAASDIEELDETWFRVTLTRTEK